MAYNYEYPYTDVHRHNDDWMINRVKELSLEWIGTRKEWNNTREEFASLKAFIQNYFVQLDVQDEVNVKLDIMARDGSLSALISPLFSEYKKEIDRTMSEQNGNISILEARMDAFTALSEGSTSGDAELFDARVDIHGRTHSNVGDHIRVVAGELFSEIDEIKEKLFGRVYDFESSYIGGKYYFEDGDNIIEKTSPETDYRIVPPFELKKGSYLVTGGIAPNFTFFIEGYSYKKLADIFSNYEYNKSFILTIENDCIVKLTETSLGDTGIFHPVTLTSKSEVFTTTYITVSPNGGDFTSLIDAMASINDNSETNRYIINVKNGIYEYNGTPINLKNYVSIVGENKEKTIIKNTASTTTYNANQNVFDVTVGRVEYSCVKNLTAIIEGGKGAFHCDTSTDIFVDGGLIEIDNCILIDNNKIGMTNLPLSNGFYDGGGVNVGFMGKQTIKVTNCISNGCIYSHSAQNQVESASFIVENCIFNTGVVGALGSNVMNICQYKNCKFNYLMINVYNEANIFDYIVTLDNCDIDMICGRSINRSFGYEMFDDVFDGKFRMITTNNHFLGLMNGNVSRLKPLYLSNYNSSTMTGKLVTSVDNGLFIGIAMENAINDEFVTVLCKGCITLNIDGVKIGDNISFINGIYTISNEKPILKYLGINSYGLPVYKIINTIS